MSVLDTFVLLFDADTSGLKKAEKEANDTLDEIENKIQETDDVTNELNDSFMDMVKGAGAALAAVLSVGVISSKVLDAANQAFEISQLSKALGENAAELDAWGAAIESNGGDAQTFFSSIEGFNERVQELSLVLENDLSPAMRELGVDFLDQQGKARGMLEILPDLAEAFERISPEKAQGLGARFGLDRDTILLLREGRGAVDDLVRQQKLLGTITKEDEEVTRRWNRQLADNRRMMRSIFLSISTAVLPALTAFFEGLEDIFIFMSDHQTFMVAFFTVLASVALFAAKSFIIAWAAALAPILAIIAAVLAVSAAIALVIDDIVNFAKGNDSVIGRVIDMWDSWLDKIGLVGDAIRGIIDLLKSSYETTFDLFGVGDSDLAKSARSFLYDADNTALATQTTNSLTNAGSVSNRNSNVQIGTVEVNTQATDADGIAKSFNESLTDQIGQAIDDFDDGVAR